MSMSRVTFWGDGNGNWWKTVRPLQCTHTGLFNRQCQGAKGHAGWHWCYLEDGSLDTSENKSEPHSRSKYRCVSSQCPPGHKDYVSPEKMAQHHYMRTRDEPVKVTDKRLIARLDKGECPGNSCVSRPVPPDDKEAHARFRAHKRAQKRIGPQRRKLTSKGIALK